MARCFAWKYIVLFLIANLVDAQRLKDMIYMSFDGVAACFRRHNGTHQFGCSSSRLGSIGVVHLLETQEDIRWIEHNATAGPYTAIVPFSMFTRDTLMRLRNTNNINGILLTRNISDQRPHTYSPDDTCPNRYSGYQKCDDALPWNPHGSALLLEDWPFPMFYTDNQTLLEAVKTCFSKHNAHDLNLQKNRPLCALEMKSFMFATLNSESCMKRNNIMLNFNPTQFCDPLGDRNIHWPLATLKNETNSVILVTARLDASSLFDGISPGAGNSITGLVTLIATAYYLKSLHAPVDKTNVVFSLLNGEAFDYIGSSRLVFDLKEGHFNALGGANLKFDEIESIIEFGQLGKGDIYLHANNAESNPMVESLKKQLSVKEVLNDSIPPTSIQSFLQEKPDLPAIVIANHGKEFLYRYYNGILDDGEGLDFNRNDTSLAISLANIAVQVAEELYKTVTGKPPSTGDKSHVEELISEMLTCYLQSANCNLFRAASSPGAKLVDELLPLYVGVHRVPNIATSLTGQLLALLTGEELPLNEMTCHEKRFAWMAGYNFSGICVDSTVSYSTAISPAFIIEGYDMKSGNYSTWTESIWQTLSVRMFLMPPAATERLSMIVGSIVCCLSFLLVWFINSRADILFNTRISTNC